jgi:anti-sigma-K factor RskA
LKSDTQSNEAIRDYLLGLTTSEDAARVEERLLTDDKFYQELLIVEDELVDEYVAGQLTDSEIQSFESHFLNTSERREKLRFARNLKKYVARAVSETAASTAVTQVVSEPPPVRALPTPPKATTWSWLWTRPILSYSLVAAAVLVLAFAIVLIVNNLKPSQPGTGKVLAVELMPGLSRGDERIKEIAIPPDIGIVQLQLRISNIAGYQIYRGLLQTNDGSEISRQDNLQRDPASNDRITYQIPASLLKPGNYNLKLSGRNQQGEYDDLARYYFRATK